MAAFTYRLFGLTIASAIELPELTPVAGIGKADVSIALADTDVAATLVSIDDVADYAVSNGSRIAVQPCRGAPAKNVRLFLLGTAMGILLQQRGLLALHANAVEIDGRAAAFLGESGAGKSTLAAWFLARGHRAISDDVCVVRLDGDDRPMVAAGVPRFRLWRDAIERGGGGVSGFQRSFVGDDEEKYDVPVAPDRMIDGDCPLAVLYVLDRGACFSIDRLSGVTAAEALFAHTYRGDYLAGSSAAAHFHACTRLIASIPLFRVAREWGVGQLDRDVERLRDHARSLGPTSGSNASRNAPVDSAVSSQVR